MKGRLLVGVPQYSGIIRVTFPSVCACLLYTQKTYPDLEIEIYTTDRIALPIAHRRIANYFLRKKFDWLFLLEEDIIPPRDCLVKLLEANRLAASGIYYLRSFPFKPVTFEQYTGLGCMLLKREVFDYVSTEDFKWFGVYADDYYFCQAMLRAGIDIFIDATIECKHIQEVYKHIGKNDHERAKERLKAKSTWEKIM